MLNSSKVFIKSLKGLAKEYNDSLWIRAFYLIVLNSKSENVSCLVLRGAPFIRVATQFNFLSSIQIVCLEASWPRDPYEWQKHNLMPANWILLSFQTHLVVFNSGWSLFTYHGDGSDAIMWHTPYKTSCYYAAALRSRRWEVGAQKKLVGKVRLFC